MDMQDLLDQITRLDCGEPGQTVVPPPPIIAFYVRMARSMRQWKQSTLASFAGVSLSSVERLERGEKVSDEVLDRVAEALGEQPGVFTRPRARLNEKQAARVLEERLGPLQPVSVQPLGTQALVREMIKCHAYLIHRPELGEEFDGQIGTLTEWLDLAAFILSETDGEKSKGGRRALYRDILSCVRELEKSGVTVLAGTITAPQEKITDWRVAVISLTTRENDPGAAKRRIVYVDRRMLGLDRASL